MHTGGVRAHSRCLGSSRSPLSPSTPQGELQFEATFCCPWSPARAPGSLQPPIGWWRQVSPGHWAMLSTQVSFLQPELRTTLPTATSRVSW